MSSVEATIVQEAFHSIHVRRTGVLLALIVLRAAEYKYVDVGCFVIDYGHTVVHVTFRDDCVHMYLVRKKIARRTEMMSTYSTPGCGMCRLRFNNLLCFSVVHLQAELLEFGVEVLTR